MNAINEIFLFLYHPLLTSTHSTLSRCNSYQNSPHKECTMHVPLHAFLIISYFHFSFKSGLMCLLKKVEALSASKH